MMPSVEERDDHAGDTGEITSHHSQWQCDDYSRGSPADFTSLWQPYWKAIFWNGRNSIMHLMVAFVFIDCLSLQFVNYMQSQLKVIEWLMFFFLIAGGLKVYFSREISNKFLPDEWSKVNHTHHQVFGEYAIILIQMILNYCSEWGYTGIATKQQSFESGELKSKAPIPPPKSPPRNERTYFHPAKQPKLSLSLSKEHP